MIFQLRSKYSFGDDAIDSLRFLIKRKRYKKVLLLYGGGSIKKNGVFDDITKLLKSCGTQIVEFGGIQPNPHCTTIDKAVELASKEDVEIIIAAGGGSVIDASKVIANLVTNQGFYKDSWEYVIDQAYKIKNKNKPLDIVAIITLAGTASENNAASVITNPTTFQKASLMNPYGTPILTIENPVYTFSVNKKHTAAGGFDCFSHLLEQYFNKKENFSWTQEYLFANMRTILNFLPICLESPEDYDARANVLWTSTMSLNQLSSFGNENGDWNVHYIEHGFSGLWNITHGEGLALITPIYLKYNSNKFEWFKLKLEVLGKEVFGVQTAEETITKIEEFIKKIKLPTTWKEISEIKDFTDEDEKFLVKHAIDFGEGFKKEEMYKDIIKLVRQKI